MSVFFYGCITLDGYLADKNHGLSWLYETGSTEETGYEDFYRNMDVTVMGRRTFGEIAALLVLFFAVVTLYHSFAPLSIKTKNFMLKPTAGRRAWSYCSPENGQ